MKQSIYWKKLLLNKYKLSATLNYYLFKKNRQSGSYLLTKTQGFNMTYTVKIPFSHFSFGYSLNTYEHLKGLVV